MSLFAKSEKGPMERPPVGMNAAVCAFVQDVGTQEIEFNGEKKEQHKVLFCFELAAKMQHGDYAGKPFMLSKRYTLSLHKKAGLSKDLESWFSKAISDDTRKNGFDLETLIGRNCTLNLMESENGEYINIANVLPPTSGVPKLEVVNKVPPKWIDELRAKSLEARGVPTAKQLAQQTASPDSPPPSDADAPPAETDGDGLPF